MIILAVLYFTIGKYWAKELTRRCKLWRSKRKNREVIPKIGQKINIVELEFELQSKKGNCENINN